MNITIRGSNGTFVRDMKLPIFAFQLSYFRKHCGVAVVVAIHGYCLMDLDG